MLRRVGTRYFADLQTGDTMVEHTYPEYESHRPKQSSWHRVDFDAILRCTTSSISALSKFAKVYPGYRSKDIQYGYHLLPCLSC